MAEEIKLADFLTDFRGELSEAIERAQKSRLQFQLSKIDLELQFTVEHATGGAGKVEFNVLGSGVSLGGDAKGTNKAVHTVKLSLTPLWEGKPFDPRITGKEQSIGKG
jgi:Trypsin-co-occurring domain 2